MFIELKEEVKNNKQFVNKLSDEVDDKEMAIADDMNEVRLELKMLRERGKSVHDKAVKAFYIREIGKLYISGKETRDRLKSVVKPNADERKYIEDEL